MRQLTVDVRSCCYRILLLGLFLPEGQSLRAEEVDFSRDIRPILSDNCFFCHGPDEKKRAADLRLDTREGAASVLKPGTNGETELVRRICSTDPDEMMPPPKANRKLTPEQIALIKKWSQTGAAWGEHWAFRKPVRPVITAGETRQPIGVTGNHLYKVLRITRHGKSP